MGQVLYRTVTHRRLMVYGGRGAWWVFWLTLRTEGAPATGVDVKTAIGVVMGFASATASSSPEDMIGMFLDYVRNQKVDVFEVGIDDGVDLHVARMEAV